MIKKPGNVMAEIGVLSDTHMAEFDDDLLYLNEVIFKNTRLIVHCGDLISPEVADAFYDKQVFAVSGNMDGNAVKSKYPSVEAFEFSGIRFCMLHGAGYAFNMFDEFIKQFPDTDVFLYGHTHIPLIKKYKEYLFFNPGSFKSNRIDHPSRSAGLIEVDNLKACFKILDLEQIKNKKINIKEVLNVSYS
jgi:putative phosphoesterase